MNGQLFATVVFGLFVGAWLGRALFDWILDVGAPWEGILIGVAALASALISVAASVEERAGDSS